MVKGCCSTHPSSSISTSRCHQGIHQGWILSHRYSAYARSKLCNVLHTAELQRRLRPAGIQAFSVSPGRVYTGMTANLVPSLKWLIEPLVRLSFQSPAQVSSSLDASPSFILYEQPPEYVIFSGKRIRSTPADPNHGSYHLHYSNICGTK